MASNSMAVVTMNLIYSGNPGLIGDHGTTAESIISNGKQTVGL